MSVIVLAIICIILLLLLFSILHTRSASAYWNKRNVPYYSGPWLWISEIRLLLLKMSIGHFLWEAYDKFKGKVIGFHLLGAPCILVKDVDIIKNILIKDFNNFQNRTAASESDGDPVGSRILFLLRNPVWRNTRMNVASAFSTGKLRSMYPNVNNIGDNLVKFIKTHENNPVDAKETLHKFSTDSITACAFGLNANCFVDENAISRVAARKIFEYSWSRGFAFMSYFLLPKIAGIMNMKFVNTDASKFIVNMFQDIVKDREVHNDDRLDFIGKLIQLVKEKKYLIVKEEIYAQAAQFWLAGFETIGSSIMFLLHELSHHQHIQDKLREEIKSTMEKKGEITYDIIRHELPYLTKCISESLRKYPVLPFLDRVCEADYTIPGTKMTIAANTRIYISVQGLSYDSKHYPDPHKFDPERWSPENKENIEQFSYLPFGEGPRNCIGARFGKLNVAMGIVKIISELKVSPTASYEPIKFDPRGFLLSPEEIIELKFETL